MSRLALALVLACGLVVPADAGKGTRARPAKADTAKSGTQAKKVRAKRKAKPRKAKRSAHRRWRTETPDDATSSPAYRYAQLDRPACEAELAARQIAYKPEPGTKGVRMPVRLAGPLRGVEFRTNLRDAARATTPWEILDCRLVLALDDFAAILAQHDIVDVRHYSTYRAPPKSWPDDQIGTRHHGGLAIDAARFIARDGSYLDVDDHFHGRIGAKTCGEGAGPSPATPEAVKLRAILCEAVKQRLFHVYLTPNYDRPHQNHFHLEVTEGWKSFLVH